MGEQATQPPGAGPGSDELHSGQADQPRSARPRLSGARPGRGRLAGPRPIRLTLAGLLVIPMISLLALWGYATSVTLGNVVQDRHYASQERAVGAPADALTDQLMQERLQAFSWLSTGRREPVGPLNDAQRRTNALIMAFRRGADAARGVMSAAGQASLALFLARLGQLPTIRAEYNVGGMSALGAFQAYNALVDSGFQLASSLILVNNVPLYQQSAVNVEGDRAQDLASREVALVSGALATSGGRMSTAEREIFAQTVANQRLLIGDVMSQLDPDLRAAYQRVYSSPGYHRFSAMENKITASVGSAAPIPVAAGPWQSVAPPFVAALDRAVDHDRSALAGRARRLGDRLMAQAIWAGLLGLLALAASVFVLLRFGRRLTRELTGLYAAARTMAEERLPGVVERLRHGAAADAAGEEEALQSAPSKITEIDRLATAFSTAARTAVEAAVGQARLRAGVNQLFLNLSLRNQSLLHRQLAMLDSMERRTNEPAVLSDLFQLDHLTTRMRRHAESLIILSGAIPGRGWREPVPVVDVLRAAVAEVEDYVRVEVITDSPVAVIGVAVNDVIHLIAELIENATAFSPPSTPVEVKADRVANGFVAEVEDRGLGITAEEMARINERLADPAEFDLRDSDQLGMFVVGQLAARHGIKVTLRDSPYGGTTAIVLLPHDIMVAEDELEATTGPIAGPIAADGSAASAAGSKPALPGAESSAEHEPFASCSLTGRHRTARTPQGPSSEPAAGPPEVAAADGGTQLGLPRRLRQSSLAPQLRDRPPPMLSAPLPGEAAPEERTPEEARSLMASLQRGWQRGRTAEILPNGRTAKASDAAPADGPGTGSGASDAEAGR